MVGWKEWIGINIVLTCSNVVWTHFTPVILCGKLMHLKPVDYHKLISWSTAALSYTSAQYTKWQADSSAPPSDTHIHTQSPSHPLTAAISPSLYLSATCMKDKETGCEAEGSGLWLNAPSMGLFSFQPNKCVTPIITRLILSFCYCSCTSISFCEQPLLIIPLWQKGHVPPEDHDQKCKSSQFHFHTFTVISHRWVCVSTLGCQFVSGTPCGEITGIW